MKQRILLAGSTGLIGSFVQASLASRADVELLSLVRQGSSGMGEAIDFEQFCAAPGALLRQITPGGLDVGISCLGTTIRTAGSQAAMHRVDHDYVLATAKGARALGARQFILVTAVGAGGPGFYLKTKGEIEQAVRALGFERLDIIRPGFLTGPRKEHRPAEVTSQRILNALDPFMIGPLSRYGIIPAETVARAIVNLAGHRDGGRHVHENLHLRHVAEQAR